MCNRYCKKYHCGHTKYYWVFCSNTTQTNIDNDKPCEAGRVASYNQDARVAQDPVGNCCSIACCQRDLDQRTRAIEAQERRWQIPKGGAFTARKIRNIKTFDNAPPLEGLAPCKHKLKIAAERHFLKCLPWHGTSNGESLITNEDFMRWGQPLRDPRPLQVPDRPEIFDHERKAFEAEVAKWETYNITKKDRQLFQAWQQKQTRGPGSMPSTLPATVRVRTGGEKSSSGLSSSGAVARRPLTGPPSKGTLPQMQVQLLLDVFRAVHERNQLDAGLLAERVRDLHQLQGHLNALHPRRPDPRFHAIEYAIHMPMLTSLHFHMCALRYWLAQQLNVSTVNRDLAAQMEQLLVYNQERLRAFRQDFDDWLNSQSADTNRLVGFYQRDEAGRDAARREYYAAQQQAEERRRASGDVPEGRPQSRQSSGGNASLYEVTSSSSSSASLDSQWNPTRISRPAGRGTVRVVPNIQPALFSYGVGAAGVAQGGGVSSYDTTITQEPESMQGEAERERRRHREESESTQASRSGTGNKPERKRGKRDKDEDRNKRPDRG